MARLRSVIAEVRETKPEFDISGIIYYYISALFGHFNRSSAFIGPDHARIQLQNEYGALKEEYNRCRSRLEILSATSAVGLNPSDITSRS